MPHKPATKKTSKPATPDWGVKFLQVNLNGEIKKTFGKRAPVSAQDLLLVLERMADSHLRIAFSFSERNKSFICSLTGVQNRGNIGEEKVCFSSFGPTIAAALTIAAFKHYEMFEGEVDNWVDTEETYDEFG